MEDQLKYLTEMGKSLAYESAEADIVAGRFRMALGSPKLLVGSEKWRNMFQTDILHCWYMSVRQTASSYTSGRTLAN